MRIIPTRKLHEYNKNIYTAVKVKILKNTVLRENDTLNIS